MLIIKITPTWIETYNFLLILLIFWWLCRLCATMRTLCDSDVCQCDHVGRITCTCTYAHQDLEISKEGADMLIPSASSLNIIDCNTIKIKRKSFEELKSLLRINLKNIKNITLEEHSFSWNDSAIYETYVNNGIHITIENSTVSNLPSYVFRGRIDAINFTDVRIQTVRSYAFTSLAGSKSITFKNCTFVKVEDQAFKKFTLDDRLSIVDCRFDGALPSRTMMDIAIKNEFRIDGVTFDHIHSSAFYIHGPHKFRMQNCYVSRIDGEAFVVHTRGPVFVDDNIFRVVETGAFAGINVQKHIVAESGHQEFVFENNTVAEIKRASLLFDINSFMPKIDWIYLNARCDCKSLPNWLSEVIVYSHKYPDEKIIPNLKLDEIISCRNDDDQQYVRLKDFSREYCAESSPSLRILAYAGIATFAVIVALVVLYWLWFRNKRTRWINVPQSSPIHEPVPEDEYADVKVEYSSPCYEEPSTSRRRIMVIPDGNKYKETELHVIVECAEPAVHEYSNRFRERAHEYSNRYVELEREYKNSRIAAAKRQLITSDL